MKRAGHLSLIPWLLFLRTKRLFIFLAVSLLAFNVWHNTTRRIWNFSVIDALSIGPNVLELAQSVDPSIQIKRPYDGQFFYAQTWDPLLQSDTTTRYLDTPYYRARRVFYPLMSYLLAFGKPTLFPYSLLLINISAWLLIGYIGFQLAKELNVSPVLLSISLMTTTGLVFAVFRTLCEPVALFFSLTACLAWQRQKNILAGMLFALSILTRESFIIIAVAAFIHRWAIERVSWKTLIIPAIITYFPFFLWIAYLRVRLPDAPNVDTSLLSLPFIGLFKDLQIAQQTLTTHTEKIRTYSVFGMGCILIAISFVAFRYRKSFWAMQMFFQGLFCSVIHGTIWSYYASSARALIPLMSFAFIWFLEQSEIESTQKT